VTRRPIIGITGRERSVAAKLFLFSIFKNGFIGDRNEE